MKIATVELASCAGCHCAILDLHYRILPILKEVQIVYSPLLVDVKEFPDHVDATLIEGSIRTDHDLQIVKEVREKSSIVIALGSCACFGGIYALLNVFDTDEAFKYVYERTVSTSKGGRPSEGLYKVLDKIRPISDVIKVDYELPGCAAEPSEIEAALVGLLKGNLPPLSLKSVCEECERDRFERPPKSFKRVFQEPEPKKCLLEQGYPCMGPCTRAGCKAKCPAVGIPCEGCRGPSIKEWDQGVSMLDALAPISFDMVKNYNLKTYTGIFHRFTYAKSILAKISKKGEV